MNGELRPEEVKSPDLDKNEAHMHPLHPSQRGRST